MLPPIDSLAGRLVTLQPFLPADVTTEYVGWLNDPEVVRFSNQRFRHHSPSSCQDYVASFDGSPHRFLKILRQADGRMVGTMTAYAAVPHGTADMGIMLGCRSTWGQGIGQDAWNTLLQWLLDTAGIRKVTGGAMRCNQAMVRIMERAGMTLEAVRPAQEMLDGIPQDLVYFGKFRDAL
ncbi:GNAT family N-acetyltransferase [Laribacter hongkongensis]|uniref:GNAT family N-acetyltransferase n=1 Tax=Laribacter hongkongensis TaxID=168471 RepID=UPI0023D963A8|nr:GNAT family protein [Laribacter hongkongensis]MCG9094393.1 GNAT family N-acetyltransferase [Laribacter hongkongensis]